MPGRESLVRPKDQANSRRNIENYREEWTGKIYDSDKRQSLWEDSKQCEKICSRIMSSVAGLSLRRKLARCGRSVAKVQSHCQTEHFYGVWVKWKEIEISKYFMDNCRC